MNIAILAGGLSPERDVSLTSGSLIANALMKQGHKVLLIDAYLGMEIDDSRPLDELFSTSREYFYRVPEEAPELDALKASRGGEALLGPNVVRLCMAADVTFLALHGAAGENGQTQATLDSYGVRYTGSGYIGSLLAMDKDIAKRILASYGIRTPMGLTLDLASGVSMVNSREELVLVVETARKYEPVMLVEKRIVGREFTVGVLDGRVLPPVEIIPKSGFYDYKNKYQAGFTEEVCPAELSREDNEALGEITLRAFAALHLRDYARFDYIRDEEGRFWCLEANTLPGMTPTSLLPQEAAAVGIDYGTLCVKIAELALKH